MKAKTFQRLLDQWQSDDCLQAGREIYLAIASDHRPGWAAAILRWCVQRADGSFVSIEQVYAAALEPARWREAHALFQEVRGESRAAQHNLLVTALFQIAETTAKVTYNASGQPAPFDAHAGWLMAPRLRDFARLHAPGSLMPAWNLLVGPLRHRAA